MAWVQLVLDHGLTFSRVGLSYSLASFYVESVKVNS